MLTENIGVKTDIYIYRCGKLLKISSPVAVSYYCSPPEVCQTPQQCQVWLTPMVSLSISHLHLN